MVSLDRLMKMNEGKGWKISDFNRKTSEEMMKSEVLWCIIVRKDRYCNVIEKQSVQKGKRGSDESELTK